MTDTITTIGLDLAKTVFQTLEHEDKAVNFKATVCLQNGKTVCQNLPAVVAVKKCNTGSRQLA